MNDSRVQIDVENRVATIIFGHDKANCLTLASLRLLADRILEFGQRDDVGVIVIRSEGEKSFCAGASFEEFQLINTREEASAFFMGFANLILAMKSVPKFIVARVQGKAVGGGVGVLAAADYTIAVDSAAVRLSEFELGIGPFTIGPAVVRRVGAARFSALALDTEWRSAAWCLQAGLFDRVFPSLGELDIAVAELTERLARAPAASTLYLKQANWADTADWERLLAQRAEISGELLLTETRKILAKKL